MTKSKSQVLKEGFYQKFVEPTNEGNIVNGSEDEVWSWIELQLTQQKSEIIKEILNKIDEGKWENPNGIPYRRALRSNEIIDVIEQLKKCT